MVDDKFNLRMIYPTKDNGITWFFDPTVLNSDPRFTGATLKGNESDGYTPGSGNSSIKVTTPSGYDENALPANFSHALAASRGYFYSANDWSDTEQTAIVKWVTAATDTLFTMYCRGGKHTSSHFCPGFAYKLETNRSGQMRFGKEQWHTSHVWHSAKSVFSSGMVAQGWYGVKMVCYVIDIGGKPGIKLEAYVDKNLSNNYELVLEDTDKGGWGNNDDCGGSQTPKDQIGFWKAPTVVYSFNNLGDIRIKQMSVREINAGGTFTDPTPAENPRVTSSLRMHYRIGTSSAPTCIAVIPQDPNPPPPTPPPGNVNVQKKIAFSYDVIQ